VVRAGVRDCVLIALLRSKSDVRTCVTSVCISEWK
jgi:hypothetical protein